MASREVGYRTPRRTAHHPTACRTRCKTRSAHSSGKPRKRPWNKSVELRFVSQFALARWIPSTNYARHEQDRRLRHDSLISREARLTLCIKADCAKKRGCNKQRDV